MSDSGSTVAEQPTRVKSPASRWSRSRLTERWVPRFESARLWISSTTTYSTDSRRSRNFGEFRRIASVSGVVFRMWGASSSICWRS